MKMENVAYMTGDEDSGASGHNIRDAQIQQVSNLNELLVSRDFLVAASEAEWNDSDFIEFWDQTFLNFKNCLPVCGMFLSLSWIVTLVITECNWNMIVLTCIAVLLNLFWFLLNIKIKRMSNRVGCFSQVMPFLCLSALIIIWNVVDQPSDVTGATSDLPWITLIIYMSHITLPISGYLVLALSSVIFSSYLYIEFVSSIHLVPSGQFLAEQATIYVTSFLCASLLGATNRYSTKDNASFAYVSVKQIWKDCERTKRDIKYKDRLLTSIIPQHVSEEISESFDDYENNTRESQFRKMFMTKYDDVSILFADIVGFTGISSLCTAEHLVKMLNDIFATFDQIAVKYHQLRLKILGDCYYCICGIPEKRTDHAQLSVYMGLEMTLAIRNISSKVNMRVGVHSGSVMGGVLGLQQWQFDVLGKDVTIANKMESTGKPGRVHITGATKVLLGNIFELEKSTAGQENEFLKQHGIDTYFVVHPRHLTVEAYSAYRRQSIRSLSQRSLVFPTSENNMIWNESVDEPSCGLGFFSSKLRLKFHDQHREETYKKRNFRKNPLQILCSTSVIFLHSIRYKDDEMNWQYYIIACFGLTMLVVLNVVLKSQKEWGRKSRFDTENLIIGVGFLLVAAWELVFMEKPRQEAWLLQANITCIKTTGMTSLLIGALTALNLSFLYKCIYCGVFTTVFLSLLILVQKGYLYETYTQVQFFSNGGVLIFLQVITHMIILIFLTYQEKTSRQIFLWYDQAMVERRQVHRILRRKNNFMYSIFAPPIAKEFLSRLYNKERNDLCSRTHDRVGVMFAACPNFDEFYAENSDIESGMGSLRFLNEILSDYDELLKEEDFDCLCKIKTIGATYMIASGLSLGGIYYQKAEVDYRKRKENRWFHLNLLVKFALRMQQTIENINRDSFNSFQLRIGINHGPVVGGVIGIEKPHYDIWGNTVNVASRMESTGDNGKIQVVKETMTLLETYGYQFVSRGTVKVKGKGYLQTYFLKNE